MKRELKLKSDQESVSPENGSKVHGTSSRRDFLKLSAATAVGLGSVGPLSAAGPDIIVNPDLQQQVQGKDPYALAARFAKYLRVTDVTDGLDAVGRADLTLMDPAIRPLWFGMRFWGPAVTMRVIPTNRRMPVIDNMSVGNDK